MKDITFKLTLLCKLQHIIYDVVDFTSCTTEGHTFIIMSDLDTQKQNVIYFITYNAFDHWHCVFIVCYQETLIIYVP